MTSTRTQRMRHFVFLTIFLLGQHAGPCDGGAEKRIPPATDVAETAAAVPQAPQENAAESGHNAVPHARTENINKTADNVTSRSGDAVSKETTVSSKEQHLGEAHGTALSAGAFLRGFYVCVGLSIVVMAYIVCRSLRLNKTRAQMVRKYGVLTHRQDVEMRPLPLEEEDDEDTTVFDASNVLTNSVQHQNL